MEKIKTLKDLEKLRQSILAEQKPGQPLVTVCGGTGCLSNGSERVAAAFAEEMKKQGLDGKVVLKLTGCHGFCEARAPGHHSSPGNFLPASFGRRIRREIVAETLVRGKPSITYSMKTLRPEKRFPNTMKFRFTNIRCASPCGIMGQSIQLISKSTLPTEVVTRFEASPGHDLRGDHHYYREVRASGPRGGGFPDGEKMEILPRRPRRCSLRGMQR